MSARSLKATEQFIQHEPYYRPVGEEIAVF